MAATPPRIRVLLADDHSVVRDGLKLILEGSGAFEVVGEAKDGAEAVTAAAELAPDVVVMDVMMPHQDGVEACREIMASASHTRVLMLTASTEEDAVIDAVAAGATGYLQKAFDGERLLAAVRAVAAGEPCVPASVLRRVFAAIRSGSAAAMTGGPNLTPREREILTSFAQGMSYTQIAEVRSLKPVSIRNAVYGIQRKLGVGSKQEVVVWAVRNGLLDDVRIVPTTRAATPGPTPAAINDTAPQRSSNE